MMIARNEVSEGWNFNFSGGSVEMALETFGVTALDEYN